MPQRTATIGSLPEAFGMMMAMRADGLDWGTGCRQAVRRAPAGIIRDGMAEDVDRWLGSPEGCNGRDRRNGTYRRRPTNRDKALMPDGVVPARKTGADAVRRPVLVAP